MSTSPGNSKQPPAVDVLERAAVGLLFPSETDAPFTAFFWPDAEAGVPTPARVIELAGLSSDQPIKSVKLETFFRAAIKEEDWHNDEEKAETLRFQELVKTTKDTLRHVKVFRVGETKIDVYIVGVVENGYAGLRTQLVET